MRVVKLRGAGESLGGRNMLSSIAGEDLPVKHGKVFEHNIIRSMTCVIEGCSNKAQSRSMCHKHYRRFLVHGTATRGSVRDLSPAERFALKHRVDDRGCWIWQAATQQGYGVFWLNGKQHKAHRVSYEMHRGPIPNDLQLDHLCRVRACVNPDHLDPVTPRVNTLRSFGVTALRARQTHCIHGHEFTAENTYVYAGRKRGCLTCRRKRSRDWHERRRQVG
ncbi:HNH endonuclease [Gordonia phage Malisha]|nr:HNH endonuclease [Gordonia phage Malisha]